MLKKIILMFILASLPSISLSADKKILSYVISSMCVSSIEVIQGEENGKVLWGMIVSLNKDGAVELLEFTSENIIKLVSFVNGSGIEIKTDILQEPLSDTLNILDLDSKSKAIELKGAIMNSKEKCGKLLRAK